ncbi:MAG: hypothetical protein HQK53_01075 [Oligoflexia bacterium]|nr:hypothetical protein [Oligoflexia bacterium]
MQKNKCHAPLLLLSQSLSQSLLLSLLIISTLFFSSVTYAKITYNYNIEHLLSFRDFDAVYYLPGGAHGIRTEIWDPSESLFEGNITCTSKKCISPEEAVDAAVSNGYLTKGKLESVFQARQRILKSIGHLLPRISLNLGLGVLPCGVLDTISNLLGFLIPSNWFNWKESKLIYAAEKSSYLGILQNQISDTEILYYNIHRVALTIKIYEYYAGHLAKLIEHIKLNNNERKIQDEDIVLLENLLDEIRSDAKYADGIISDWYTYDLAVAMAYPDQGTIGIRPIALPDLRNEEVYSITESDLVQIRANSSDLLTLRYLAKAVSYSRLSRSFNFIGTTSSSGRTQGISISFGLDNISEIRISSSEKRNLEISIQENAAKIESTFRKAVDSYNTSIDLYKEYVNAKGHNSALFYSILGRYTTDGVLDSDRLISAIYWAIKFEVNRSFVQHSYLIAKSQMDRLLVRGDKYTKLSNSIMVPANEGLHHWQDRIKIRENRDIDNDINRGVLDLNNP